MTKEQKVIWIKCWLQEFGERDNKTFNVQIALNDETWDISMQYNYDFEGFEMEPNHWCRNSFKHLRNNKLEDRTEDELDGFIAKLKKIKQVH